MLAGRHRDVLREDETLEESYTVDYALCGDRGLHSLAGHHISVEVPLGHSKYSTITCVEIGGAVFIAANSRKLLEVWRVLLTGDVAFYTCIELTDSPHQLIFSSCGTVICCCEGRSTVTLRPVHTLEAIVTWKHLGEHVSGAAFASRGDVTALNRSRGETANQMDDVVAICYNSGKVVAWGIYDLLMESRMNVANNRIIDCQSIPAQLLEYNLTCKQAPCWIACVSRSLTSLDAKSGIIASGHKGSSFIATGASLFLIVCDRDSKLWLLEANVPHAQETSAYVNDHLPYICREVRCLDLDRETRFHSSPRRPDRDATKRNPGGRIHTTPIKSRPSVSGARVSVNMNPAGGRVSASPSVVAQKPSASAVLSLSLMSSTSTGASLPMVMDIVILTQTTILHVDIQTFRLKSCTLVETLGLSSLAFGSVHRLSSSRSHSGGFLLSLLPAFDHSMLPYVYMSDIHDAVQSNGQPSDRRSLSPIKAPNIPKKSIKDNADGDLGIFANRPPPSWALSAAEKNNNSVWAKKNNDTAQEIISTEDNIGGCNTANSPVFSFFTSSRQQRTLNDDGNMEDDLRIGLPSKSPLLTVYRPPPTPEMHQGALRTSAKGRASGGSWEVPKISKTKGGKIQDMPVTFHDRIKSSGYGQNKPKQLSFAEKAKQKPSASTKGTGAEVYSDRTTAAHTGLRSVSAPRNGRIGGKAGATTGRLIRAYPVECGPCLSHQPQHDYPCSDIGPQRGTVDKHVVGPLHGLCYSEDGAWVGMVSQDSAVETLRTPVGKHNGAGLVYCGHDSGLNGISFSHNNNFMISASKDGTARMWRLGRVEAPAVIFSHRQSHPRIGGPGKLGITSGSGLTSKLAPNSSRNKPYGGEVAAAQFFHLDRFVMLAAKSSVFMYSFEPEGTDALNDIKRLQSFGKYKLVTEYSHADTHRVSALACINSVQSVLCISATADRKMHLLDASVGSVVRTVDVTHERAIHCIALPQPSVHCRVQDPHAYNMFATASTDNSILLWDIRVPGSVCRYGSHVNRREAVSCCLSPCMRYLATGSEDRTARVVDLRTGMKEIGKVGTGLFKDVVTGVAYHPLHAQLGACSFDGTIKFFKDHDCDGIEDQHMQLKTGGRI